VSSVAVLGAGPAGLMAALEAAEAGHDVVLYEAADHMGGMAASFEIAGQRVDYGSHRLHPATDPQTMARIKGLLGDDLQARERNGRIRLRERWVGFPLRALDMVRSLPLDFSVRVARDTVTGSLRRVAGDSFAAEVTRRLGPTVFSEFYEPYTYKLYGARADQLHRELADRRVAASSPAQIVAKVARATRSDGRLFWYPKHGYGQIAERLADAAVAAGVDLRLGSAVDRIELGRDGPVGIRAGAQYMQADIVLSTIPQATLGRVVTPSPGKAVVEALRSLRTRAMVLVYLVVEQDQYTPFDAHYFPEAEITMCRLSEPKNYRSGDDPTGQTVLCAELACWQDDAVWTASDTELGELVCADLSRAGLPAPNVTHVETRRLPHVYPVFEHDTMNARQIVQTWAQDLDHVLSFGRQGLAVPDNLHHVLAMGRAAASAVGADGNIADAQWKRSLDKFATHVVQD